MKQVLLFGLLVLSAFSSLYAQCTITQVIELRGYTSRQGTFVVSDSIWYGYDASGDLQSAEEYRNARSDNPLHIARSFEAAGSSIIRQTVVIKEQLSYLIVDEFMSTYPGNSCIERSAFSPEGKRLAYEDLSVSNYGLKKWDGIGTDYRVYAEYKLSPTNSPSLLYVTNNVDGVYQLSQVLIFRENDRGDYISIQRINVAGFGLQEEEYRYTYDNCGNWTEKYRISEGISYLEARRIISYR